MSPTRRQVLMGLGGVAVLAPLAWRGLLPEARAGAARYLSPRSDRAGRRFYVTGFDPEGALQFDRELPARGHGLALHPLEPQVVVVARRPGRYLLVLEAATGEVLQRLASRPDRHFYGHAEFSPDGRWLFTPENDYEAGRGVIGVRDVENSYRQVAELASHGIGPHDLRLLSDGHTLVVANGGILTHPAQGRAKLNLKTMTPSLVYLDTGSGELLEQQELPERWHQVSIRHLALSGDDRVCFIMQHQGTQDERPPLVGLHRRGEELTLCVAPAGIEKRMKNYCGSACTDPSGQFFAVSSPHGDLVTFWQAASGAYAGHVDIPNGCGVAPGSQAGEFLLSSGEGGIFRSRVGPGRLQELPACLAQDLRWDNHMARFDPRSGPT